MSHCHEHAYLLEELRRATEKDAGSSQPVTLIVCNLRIWIAQPDDGLHPEGGRVEAVAGGTKPRAQTGTVGARLVIRMVGRVFHAGSDHEPVHDDQAQHKTPCHAGSPRLRLLVRTDRPHVPPYHHLLSCEPRTIRSCAIL